jgi:hypothetical protein
MSGSPPAARSQITSCRRFDDLDVDQNERALNE